jgi:hypothetical protein
MINKAILRVIKPYLDKLEARVKALEEAAAKA